MEGSKGNSTKGWGNKNQKNPLTSMIPSQNKVEYKKKEQQPASVVNMESAKEIPGLVYVRDFITKDEEKEIVKNVDKENWSHDLKRRVQQYGYTFSYETKQVDPNFPTDPMPSWLEPVRNRLVEGKYFPVLPDQLIINEYNPGQGISPHKDKTYCFDECVASISLLSPCIMDFSNTKTLEKVPVLLEPRSLVVLTGDARYKWTHGITARETDTFDGRLFNRGRRVSLTYRIMIQTYFTNKAKESAMDEK